MKQIKNKKNGRDTCRISRFKNPKALVPLLISIRWTSMPTIQSTLIRRTKKSLSGFQYIVSRNKAKHTLNI